MKVDVSQLALDYLYCVEEEYREAREKKISRMDIQWGKYSHQMNKATRQLIREKHPDSFMLKLQFNIWVAYSELLELYYRYPAANRKKKEKRKLITAIKLLKKVLKTGNVPNMFEKYIED